MCSSWTKEAVLVATFYSRDVETLLHQEACEQIRWLFHEYIVVNLCTVWSSLFVYSFGKEILLVSLHAFAEAEQIKNQYSEASTMLATVEHEISDLESKLKGDFGRFKQIL